MYLVYLSRSNHHSLLFISIKNPHLLCYLFYIVVICNKFLIFCFYNNSSTYDDNDSGVQDTVLPTPTKQYGSYTDGKHPTPPLIHFVPQNTKIVSLKLQLAFM